MQQGTIHSINHATNHDQALRQHIQISHMIFKPTIDNHVGIELMTQNRGHASDLAITKPVYPSL
jgi:hypothetical protein